MNTREELEAAERAFIKIKDGEEFTIYLRWGFQIDPASGRREWDTIELPLATREMVIKSLETRVLSLRSKLAKELREEASKLEAKNVQG